MSCSLALNGSTVGGLQWLCHFAAKPPPSARSRSNHNYVLLIMPRSNKNRIGKNPILFLFGQGWIRTTVVSRRQIYSLLPLATRAPTLIKFSKMPLTGFEPVASPLPRECATPAPQRLIATRALKKPAIGIEPTTYGLQNRCSTVELCRRHMSILLRKF